MTSEPVESERGGLGPSGVRGCPPGNTVSPRAGTASADGGAGPGLRASARPLSETYDTALLDLDGVVYLGGTAIPGAAQALQKASAAGMALAYVTNNASRTPRAICEQLAGLGVPVRPESVITSAQAAARLLSQRLPRGAPVLVIGGTGLRMAVRERGLRPVTTAAERPAAVVQGYARDISYPLLAEGALAVDAGALFVASNADATLPSTRGRQPGNGALIQVVRTATGHEPIVAGKPEPPMHSEALIRTGARRPLIVGDRLDTDIEGANNVGADSLLVLTGVTTPVDLVLAPPRRRPSYVAADLTGLLEPHPMVRGGPRQPFRCNGWEARPTLPARGGTVPPGDTPDPDGPDPPAAYPLPHDRPTPSGVRASVGGDDAYIELTGSGDRVDALRVICAAAWSQEAVTRAMVAGALRAANLG
jgi:glycerol-1-phosphatase